MQISRVVIEFDIEDARAIRRFYELAKDYVADETGAVEVLALVLQDLTERM